MARHVPTRWNLGEKDLVRLTAEAKAYRGESLWRDAWRRLRRSRPSHWSLVFLALFGLTSLAAPLLPLPSPIALSLRPDASPPEWPFSQPAPPETDPAPGTGPTREVANWWNDGWRHRTVLAFRADLGAAEAEGDPYVSPDGARVGEVRRFVRELTGRAPALEVRASEDPEDSRAFVYAAVPLREDDRPRIEHEPRLVAGADGAGGLEQARGNLVVARAGAGTARGLHYDLALAALDASQVAGWSVEQRGRSGRILLSRANDGAPLDGRARADWAAVFRLPARLDGTARAVTLNGVPLAGSAAPDPTLPRDEVRVAEVVLEEGFVHEDLGRRAQRALAAQPLAGVEYVDSSFEGGYWDLVWFDEAMLRGRAATFGLWQTGNWMGTDSKGRDLLSRILWGSRTSILVAIAAALTSLLIGVTYGAVSGYLGGRVDNLMMRIVDVLYAVPFIFVVIFLITIVSEMDDLAIDREVLFFFVIGAIYWLTMARVVRGQVLQLKNTEFIEAARVMGASTTRVLFSHLIPNVLSIVIVYLTLTIPAVMLFEAFLSFLGLGIEPPKVSWGLLARDGTEAITPLNYYWWLVVFPALAMGSTLLALNVLGDGLRDALDPKLRGKS